MPTFGREVVDYVGQSASLVYRVVYRGETITTQYLPTNKINLLNDRVFSCHLHVWKCLASQ